MYNIILIFVYLQTVVHVSDAQFAYPVDPNPPTVESTFSCYECSGNNCEDLRVQGTHTEKSCTGPRVACWTVRNGNTLEYTRTCVQPQHIRQGVFCNRHMVGKEFCFAATINNQRMRLCAKCCLSDRCNGGTLQGLPDSTLQTCVACNGASESICNSDIPMNSANSTYVEQCLLPNSDCWTERRMNSGVSLYTRGCQLRTCDANGVNEVCVSNSATTTCSQCCRGNMCNRFTKGAASMLFSSWATLTTCLAVVVFSKLL